MLRACRSVLRPGGRLAFFTIFATPDVPRGLRRRLLAVVPPCYLPRAQHRSLLRTAGFERVEEMDVTDEYHRVQRALYEANLRHERGLRRALGDAEYDQRQTTRREALRGIEAGVLRRALYVGERSTSRLRSPPSRSAP